MSPTGTPGCPTPLCLLNGFMVFFQQKTYFFLPKMGLFSFNLPYLAFFSILVPYFSFILNFICFSAFFCVFRLFSFGLFWGCPVSKILCFFTVSPSSFSPVA